MRVANLRFSSPPGRGDAGHPNGRRSPGGTRCGVAGAHRGDTPPAATQWSPRQIRVVPGLAYTGGTVLDGGVALQRELEQAARSHFGGLPDVWHVHNHTLGKNLALTATFRVGLMKGNACSLQIHDFPEDGRLKSSVASDVNRSESFNQLIRQSNEASRRTGVDFPEVEIQDIWREFRERFGEAASMDAFRRQSLVIAYERQCNPV